MANPVRRFARSLAVVIGINEYQHIRQLTTAVNDAAYLATLLGEQHGYDDVVTLTVDVTRARLQTFFGETLPSQVKPDDRLLVYFAGHGIALDGDDGPEGYLIPQDARADDRRTFVAMADLYGWLEQLPCRHLLVVLDCCFAGAFNWYRRRDLRPVRDILYQEHYDRFVREPAWQILTSAAYNQEALDVLVGRPLGVRDERSDDRANHSPFAVALFDALAGEGDLIPKDTGDGVVTATELYLYLRQRVEVDAQMLAKHPQTPELWPFSREKHGKGEYIFLVPNRSQLSLPQAPTLTTDNRPYRGLESYDYSKEHAALFFGRAEQIKQLAAQVIAHPFTVVLGASGTGKSSLVKAGLLPSLKPLDQREGGENGKRDSTLPPTAASYCILPPLRPGDTPLRGMADLLAAQWGQPTRAESEAILVTVEHWAATHPEMILLLVIDQCEELITLTHGEEERKAFLNTLAILLVRLHERLRLVFTLRIDFEPQFAHTPLTPYWQASRFVVPPLSQAELREVIELPAAQRVLFFDSPDLVDRLIDEVIQTPGALPLLSFTLNELYLCYLARQDAAQKNDELIERTLTAVDYEKLGGVIGSLRTRADAVYDRLDKREQATMQRVMLRMVAVEGGELARRRVPLSELEYPDDEENLRVTAIIKQLVDARLLVAGQADTDGDSIADKYVEPAHDALVRAWDKLLVWKHAADEYLPLQRRLTTAANDWTLANPQAKTRLLWHNNPRLPQVTAILSGHQLETRGRLKLRRLRRTITDLLTPTPLQPVHNHWLNKVELAFVCQSVDLQLRSRRRLVGTVASVITALTLLLILALFFWQQAEQRQRVARAGELAAQARVALAEQNSDLAILLAIEAVTTTVAAGEPRVPEAEDVLRSALTHMGGIAWESGHGVGSLDYMFAVNSTGTGGVNDYAFSPDGHWLTTAGDDGTVRLHELADLNGSARILPVDPEHAVDAIAYSLDSRLLLTKSWDRISLWDAQTLSVTNVITGFAPWDSEGWVDLSFDGHWVINVDKNDDLHLWESTDSLASTRVFTDAAAIGLSTNQRWLALIQSKQLILWDLAEMNRPVASWAIEPATTIEDFEVSSDGRWVAASQEGVTRVWDLHGDHHKPVALPNEGTESVRLAISPDSQWLVTVRADEFTYFWKLTDLTAPPKTLTEPGHSAGLILFSPDGRLLVTNGDQENTVKVWNLAQLDDEPTILTGYPSRFGQISPDNQWLATQDGASLRLFDLTKHGDDLTAAYVSLSAPMYEITALEISPDGQWLSIGNLDGLTRLWNLIDPASPPIVLDTDGPEDDNEIYSVAFSPNQRWLATGGYDRNVRLYEMADLSAPPAILSGQQGSVRTLAFSLDNRWLISAGGDQRRKDYTARVWNLTNLKAEPVVLENHSGEILKVLISPNSRWLALSSMDETVSVWDLKRLDKAPRVFEQGFSVNTLAFSPDSRWLATGSGDPYGDSNFDDTNVRMWDLASGRTTPRKVLAGLLGHISDIVFSPDGRWVAAGSQDGKVRLWQTADLNGTPTVLTGHTDSISDLAISTDSRWLISGSDDLTARIWDLENLDSPSVRLPDHPQSVNVVAITPDGRWVATAGDWGTIRLWPLHIEELITEACRTLRRNLSYEEWQARFAQSAPHLTCQNHPLDGSFIAEARARARAGDITGAEQQYSLAKSIDPDLGVNPTYELARILQDRAYQSAYDSHYDEALYLFRRAARYDPSLDIHPEAQIQPIRNKNESEALNAQGEQLADAEDYQQALEYFTNAIQLNPTELPKAYYNRGRVDAILNDPQAATGDFTKAIEFDYRPAADVYLERARAYFELGLDQAALADFIQVNELDPSATSQNHICWYGALSGNAENVISACEQAVALDPENGNYRDSRGLALTLLGQYEQAIADFAYFVEWAKQNEEYATSSQKREGWIATLKAGKNPFNPETLAALRSE